MIVLFVRRLIGGLLVLLIASFVAFAMLDLMPGDASLRLAGDHATQEQIEALRHELGFDQPMIVRYSDYISKALQGDFGKSLVHNRPVSDLIFERFRYTLMLSFAAIGLSLLLGLSAGFFAARRAGSWFDLAVMGITSLGLSIPSFWLALMFMLLFSVHLKWLPVLGADTPKHLILPTVTLALPSAALFARLSRASLLDVKRSEYVRTAYGKGASHWLVWRDHIWRNSLMPVLTMGGINLGHLLGGAFIIETIFAWPGLGRMMVQAIFDQDFPIIMGGVLLLALLYLSLTLLVDLLHLWIDPRIRQENL